jgi:hypothetical protein
VSILKNEVSHGERLWTREADDANAAGTDWGGDCSNSVFHVRLA